MNCLNRTVLTILVLLAGLVLVPLTALAAPSCHGKFMNPITDICWSCAFPMSIGAASLIVQGQEDISNPSSPVCFCDNPPRVGLSIGFWEPARLVDVTRQPFCMVALGGISFDPGIDAPRGAQVSHDSQTSTSFYQVHWYVNPILTYLEVLLDFPCLEQGSLDLAYLTEVDPLWADDELTAILNPDAVLFANPAAKAACAADCVAATAGFPISSLFWCAGCQGSIYPMDGHVTTHIGAVQASTLLDATHGRQDAPAIPHLERRRSSRAVRLLHAADHGQDPVQDADGLSHPEHAKRRRPMLPAVRAHHRDLGCRQGISRGGRRFRVPDLPQKELLCQRFLIA